MENYGSNYNYGQSPKYKDDGAVPEGAENERTTFKGMGKGVVVGTV